MNIKRPFQSFIIILVGKSNCLEAVKNFKDMSICLTKLLSRQCKVHTSHKLQETFRLYSYYSRIWGEEMTRQMFSKIQKSLILSGKTFLLSAVCLTPYDWKKYKIPDENLESSVSEYDSVGELCNATVCCETCHKRQVIDTKVNNIDYCMCKGSVGYTDRSRNYDAWEPFLERENILVWRKKHHKYRHLYCYKVYGTYSDMSLNSFMEVQLNPSFRTQWDTSALELKVIDTNPESNSELLYWLVRFPHFFANRDYIFKRRYKVNEKKKEVVILNEIAEHSQIPEEKKIHRVKEYWSIMVLKADESFNKPGMSYTLTYFDNPGTSLPVTVTNFVASTAFPDFLKKVHTAAMSLQRQWENGKDVYVTLPPSLRYLRKWKEETNLSPVKDSIFDPKEKTIGEQFDENNIDDSTKKKIALRFRSVVIDLLEAIEVVTPEYGERSILTGKIETFVDKLGFKNNKKQKLVKKLETLSNKTKMFLKEAAEKKEESLKIMNEIERRHYYDQTSTDEPTLQFFQDLLQAINEIMKIDKDMRIGKDLIRPDSKYVKKKIKENEESIKTNKENLTNENEVHDEQNSCMCCENDGENTTDEETKYWYSYFVALTGLNSKSTKMSEANCVCNHKPNTEIKSTLNSEMQIKRTSESLDNGTLRSSFSSLVFRSESENPESSEKDSSVVYQDDSNSESDSVPWYYFSWILKYMFKATV